MIAYKTAAAHRAAAAIFTCELFRQLSINQEIKIDEDINKLCQNCVNTVEIVRTECEKNSKLSGIVSLIDSFKEKMSKLVFLGTFDKVSNIKLGK